MTKIAKNWIGCDMPGCEEEVLENWAVRTGWKLGERADWCPHHGGRVPYSGWDVKERAAADDSGVGAS